METIYNWADVVMQAFISMGEQLSSGLLNFIGAVLVLFVGWLITKAVVYVVGKILKASRVDKLTEKIKESNIFGEAKINFEVSYVITAFIRWIMYLVFIIVAADIMNWTIVSNEISNLLRYLPQLFSALALFIIGLYIANFIRKAIKGLFESLNLSGVNVLSSIVFYIIVVIFTIAALNQANIDTSVIANNITIILASILLTIAIGVGLGSRDVVKKLLFTYYARKNYNVGDKIKVGDISGEILAIDSVSVTLKTQTSKVVIPIVEMTETKVEIKE
ncbi:MAG: mechanosensitive ion channel domain-containing protein [Bacteroidales bacterium]